MPFGAWGARTRASKNQPARAGTGTTEAKPTSTPSASVMKVARCSGNVERLHLDQEMQRRHACASRATGEWPPRSSFAHAGIVEILRRELAHRDAPSRGRGAAVHAGSDARRAWQPSESGPRWVAHRGGASANGLLRRSAGALPWQRSSSASRAPALPTRSASRPRLSLRARRWELRRRPRLARCRRRRHKSPPRRSKSNRVRASETRSR